MFLSPPTLEELKQSDLTDLVDMLARQTAEYTRIFKLEGISANSVAVRDLILNIQAAIKEKKSGNNTVKAK